MAPRKPRKTTGPKRTRPTPKPPGLGPGRVYDCNDPLIGAKVSGRDFSGTVLGCATPREGERGRRLLVGRVATRGAVKRAASEVSRSRKAVAARRKRLDDHAAFEHDFRAGSPDPHRPRVLPPPPPLGWGAGSPDPYRPRASQRGGTVWETARPGTRVRWVPTKPSVIAAGVMPVDGELVRRQRTKYWSALVATPTGRVVVWANQGDLYDANDVGAFVPPPPTALQPIGPAPETPPRREFRPEQPVNLVIPASPTTLLPKLPRYRELPAMPEPSSSFSEDQRNTLRRNYNHMVALAEVLPVISDDALHAIEQARMAIATGRTQSGYEYVGSRLDAPHFISRPIPYGSTVYDVAVLHDAFVIITAVTSGYVNQRGDCEYILASFTADSCRISADELGKMTGKTGEALKDIKLDTVIRLLTWDEAPKTPEDALSLWTESCDRAASDSRDYGFAKAMGYYDGSNRPQQTPPNEVEVRDGDFKGHYRSDEYFHWYVNPIEAESRRMHAHLRWLTMRGKVILGLHRPKKGSEGWYKFAAREIYSSWNLGETEFRYATANVLALLLTQQPALDYYRRFVLPATAPIAVLQDEYATLRNRHETAKVNVRRERIQEFWTLFGKLEAKESRATGRAYYARVRAHLTDHMTPFQGADFEGVAERGGQGWSLDYLFTGAKSDRKSDLPYAQTLVGIIEQAWKGSRAETLRRSGMTEKDMDALERMHDLPRRYQDDSVMNHCDAFSQARDTFDRIDGHRHALHRERLVGMAESFYYFGIRPEPFFPLDPNRRTKEWETYLRDGPSTDLYRDGKSPRKTRPNGRRAARQVSKTRRRTRRR